MEYTNKKTDDLKIAYIGGGSRGWAWSVMGDLAIEPELSGVVKLYDIDHESARMNSIIGNRLSKRDDAKGKWRYEASQSLGEALTGADFVIISILPGSFDEMEADVHLPEKYGIYQSVGDTTGPGGLMRALRTIPMYVEMAEAIKEYSPDAWVINYTNPMTLCTRTLIEVFPEVKVIGCCHEVFGTQKLLAAMLEDMNIAKNVSHEEIHVNVLGINHFTWLDRASYKGIDLFPIYREFIEKYDESGFEEEKDNWMKNFFSSANLIHFDLFKRYGLIAAAGDRHLAEFMPHGWYLKDPETVREWKFQLTPVKWRKEQQKELLEKSRRLADGGEQVQLKPSGEEAIRIMKSLLGMQTFMTNMNLPNLGQIAGIPSGAVVETNALLTLDSARPLMAGRLPLDIESLVLRHVLNQETVLKAALNKDKALAFKAFSNDPLVSSLEIGAAEELFGCMLQRTTAYLPGWAI